MDKSARQRILAEMERKLGEALAAHSVPDDQAELALLDMHLDAEQERLEKLWHDDPLRLMWSVEEIPDPDSTRGEGQIP